MVLNWKYESNTPLEVTPSINTTSKQSRGLLAAVLPNFQSKNALDFALNQEVGAYYGNTNYLSDGNKFCVYLDGTGDYIDWAATYPIPTPRVTLSIWFRKTRDGSFERIFATSDLTYSRVGVQINASNVIQFFIVVGITSRFLNASTAITDREWHLLTATYNSIHDPACLIYLDGKLDASGNLSGGNGEISAASHLFVGRVDSSSSAYYAQVYASDGRIYDRVLNPSEIRDMYLYPNDLYKPPLAQVWSLPVAAVDWIAPFGNLKKRRFQTLLNR